MKATWTAMFVTFMAIFASSVLYAEDTPAVTLGNGEKNWIVIEDVQRKGDTLTFSEVCIDGNGWLVIHPFENGRPNGDKYVASTYVTDGKNTNVEIKVYKGIKKGEQYIVMLHRDTNENQVLDFVFVDDNKVMDSAVFEGHTMIAHVIAAP
ncbi:MAG: hypothetical protein AAF385_01445 [Pseudomonadota bacterium]